MMLLWIYVVQLITITVLCEGFSEDNLPLSALVYPKSQENSPIWSKKDWLLKHNIDKIQRRYIIQPSTTTTTEGPWTGRWLPERTTVSSLAKHITTSNSYFSYDRLFDPHHGVTMGIPASGCDDGKTNLEMDWNFSPVNYTCYNPGYQYKPNRDLSPLIEAERLPTLYVPRHICMNKPIVYNRPIPTFGDHRPLWPQYGEYKFVPLQRWLHSLEHGAVVMLYHPCANPVEVNRLRKVVKGCLRRYIITPYTVMDEQRPMAIVVWGWRMTMSTVDAGAVRKFILKKALKGPEKLSQDGQYDTGLQVPSEIVKDSNFNDDNLCPIEN